jgi:hypothetical protein
MIGMHSYQLGIMVDINCKRFVDEGENYRRLTTRSSAAFMSPQPAVKEQAGRKRRASSNVLGAGCS